MLVVVGFKSSLSIELTHYVLQHCAICILVTQHTTIYILRERERERKREREGGLERERETCSITTMLNYMVFYRLFF